VSKYNQDAVYELLELVGKDDVIGSKIVQAQILSVDRGTNTAQIDFTGQCDAIENSSIDLTAVPFYYHCEYSTGTVEDLANGHKAFAENDMVMVLYTPENDTYPETMHIVGHADLHGTYRCNPTDVLIISMMGHEDYWGAPWMTYFVMYDVERGEIFDWDRFTPVDENGPAMPTVRTFPMAYGGSDFNNWLNYNFRTPDPGIDIECNFGAMIYDTTTQDAFNSANPTYTGSVNPSQCSGQQGQDPHWATMTKDMTGTDGVRIVEYSHKEFNDWLGCYSQYTFNYNECLGGGYNYIENHKDKIAYLRMWDNVLGRYVNIYTNCLKSSTSNGISNPDSYLLHTVTGWDPYIYCPEINVDWQEREEVVIYQSTPFSGNRDVTLINREKEPMGMSAIGEFGLYAIIFHAIESETKLCPVAYGGAVDGTTHHQIGAGQMFFSGEYSAPSYWLNWSYFPDSTIRREYITHGLGFACLFENIPDLVPNAVTSPVRVLNYNSQSRGRMLVDIVGDLYNYVACLYPIYHEPPSMFARTRKGTI
jgi:hypothetical protein